MKFCPNCGNKLDDNSDFCSNCGNKINNASSNESKQTKYGVPKNFNNFMSNPKLIIVALAVIIVLAAIFLIGGSSSNELVDVTSIDMSLGYSDTPFGGALAASNPQAKYSDYQVGDAVIKFSLMPRESITRVTGLAVSNIEVDLGNGETENWGTYNFEPDDYYVENVNYKFQISHVLGDMGENIDDYYSISHIKADIVINTTDATNMVIGHIDEDIVLEH